MAIAMKTAPAAFPDLAAELTAALSGNVALLEAHVWVLLACDF